MRCTDCHGYFHLFVLHQNELSTVVDEMRDMEKAMKDFSSLVCGCWNARAVGGNARLPDVAQFLGMAVWCCSNWTCRICLFEHGIHCRSD